MSISPERAARLDAKRQRVDAKLARWFGIPALADIPHQGFGGQSPSPEVSRIAAAILTGYGDIRPASLVQLVRKYDDESRLIRAVAGGGKKAESDFVAASVLGGNDAIRLSSAQFGAGKTAFLSGFGPGEAPVRDGLVRFAHGSVTVNVVSFPPDESWGLYCLSSEENPAGAERKEVFALRWGGLPEFGADPYDFVEAGHLAAAKEKAEANGWAGAKMDGLRIVAAVRMELLIDEAVADIKAKGWLAADQQYLVEKLEGSGKRIVAGTVQAIGSRLRGSKDT